MITLCILNHTIDDSDQERLLKHWVLWKKRRKVALLCPQCFLLYHRRIPPIETHLICRQHICSIGIRVKFISFDKQLTLYPIMPLTSAEACEKSSRWFWKEKLC